MTDKPMAGVIPLTFVDRSTPNHYPTDEPALDAFQRRIDYLRVSLTDRCNMRCVYCMPLHGLPWLKRDQLLRYEEIVRIVETMAGMGLRRLRITGGEPLVRQDVPELIRMLSRVEGIEEMTSSSAS